MSRCLLPLFLTVVAQIAPGPFPVLAPPPPGSTLEMYLRLEGVPGELLLTGLEAGVDHAGAAARAHDFQVVKRLDAASPRLFVACASAAPFPTAVVTVRYAGESPGELMRYTLRGVRIKSVIARGNIGGAMNEELRLGFERIEIQYTPPDSRLQPVKSFWDVGTERGE